MIDLLYAGTSACNVDGFICIFVCFNFKDTGNVFEKGTRSGIVGRAGRVKGHGNGKRGRVGGGKV